MNIMNKERKEIQKAKAETIQFQMECGAFFRNKRLLRGKTENEVAEFLALDAQVVQDYESGKEAIPLDQVSALSEFLAIPFEEIMELHLRLEKKLMPAAQPEPSPVVEAKSTGHIVQEAREALFLSARDLATLLTNVGYSITEEKLREIETGGEAASVEFWISFCALCHLDLDSVQSYSRSEHFVRLYEVYKKNQLRIPASSALVSALEAFQATNDANSYKIWYLFRFSSVFKRQWIK